ncbi:porin family protein [Pseudovibrio ascidiaceicola]|uniref:porin family protein n=1 Tax=Pseudovibrio ascidiaceicola TaxID=285279 RepID=UPI00135CB18C|nr:porin family protein [Pseudovibrio ascidiaceicola]
MKNKLLIACATVAISMGAMASANAEDANSWYIQGTGGLSLGSATFHTDGNGPFGDDFSLNDEGFNGRIGVGTYISDNFRIGLEGGYASFSEDAIDVKVWDILAVAYYDFNNDTAFTPYVGLGAGFAQQKVDFNGGPDDETTNHFTMKVGSGVGYAISENLELLAEHSFQYNFQAELFDDLDISAYQNQFNVGLRYSF